MILADKIIELRKKNGLSQEELADKLDISRQSVSKWESRQSVPDLDKIIALSQIFSVSTDYLLKDDAAQEELPIKEEDPSRIIVTMEVADKYIKLKQKTAILIALGVFLCIISPIPLILLAGLSEYTSSITETTACMIGLVSLFVMVCLGVTLFLIADKTTKKYEYIATKNFETEYGVSGMVKEEKEKYESTYFKFNLFGIVLCILSVIPLFVFLLKDNDLYSIYGVDILILMVAFGVFLLVFTGSKNSAYVRLLQEGEYSKESKTKSPFISAFSTAYWLVATAIYLLWSFLSASWEITWIVFMIAGILYSALFAILKVVIKPSKDNTQN